MKYFISIIFLFIIFAGLTTAPKNTVEQEIYLNYVFALENRSTIGYFIVFTAKNLNTGETKEICTKAQFLQGALHMEMNLDYSDAGSDKVEKYAISNKSRYFEFKDSFALRNIRFEDYNSNLQRKLKLKYNFRSICKEIENKKEYSKRLERQDMKAFAHVLFNKGILTSESNCWGGTLRYVDRKNRK